MSKDTKKTYREDEFKKLPIVLAIERGNIDEVADLLSATPELIDVKSNIGETLLHVAAKSGDVDIFKEIFNQKPELARQEAQGRTVLNYAIDERHADIIKYILEEVPAFAIYSAASVARTADKVSLSNFTIDKKEATESNFKEIASTIGNQIEKNKALNKVVIDSIARDIEITIEEFQYQYKEDRSGKSKKQLNLNTSVENFVSRIVKLSVDNGLITPEAGEHYKDKQNTAGLTKDVDKICDAFQKSHSNLKNKLYDAVVTVTKSLGLKGVSEHFQHKVRESHKKHLIEAAREVTKNIGKIIKQSTRGTDEEIPLVRKPKKSERGL